MNRQERIGDLNESLIMAFTAMQASLWTALPCSVISYDSVKGTISCQPLIKVKRFFPDGSSGIVQLPVLGDVPVVFPRGGGFSMTFPIVQGDECLVVFASRCIDDWWQSGQIGTQIESRMHDLSDGFAIFGPSSQPQMQRFGTPVSVDSVQLRADDGLTYIEVAPGQEINIVAPTGINITGPLNVEGPVTVQGDTTITGDLTENGNTNFTGMILANGHIVDERHTHSGVVPGGGVSGPVAT